MQMALEQAKLAAFREEVPVGAILVKDNQVIAMHHNSVIQDNDPTAHAEMSVLRLGGKQQGNYRLPDTTVYVTLEPCSMCLGAMIHSRIERLVFAASDTKTGACGGAIDLAQAAFHNHHFTIQGGLLAEASKHLLQSFFQARRQSSKITIKT